MTGTRDQTIDIFRGIAILMVVLFHFTARLPETALNITDGAPWPVFFGWVGVYFFFIISGYCIFMTLERSSSVGQFLARRFSRIYPTFVAAVVLLFLFGLVFDVPSVPEANFHEVPPGPIDVVLNLLFLGELGEWIDGAFWSIAVEVKFYVLVALLAGMIPDRARFGRVFGGMALVMGLVWLGSTLLTGIGSGSVTPQSLLKFLTIAPYLSFFAIGILGWQFEQGQSGTGWLLGANLALSTFIVAVEAYAFEVHGGWIIASACAGVYLALALLFVQFVRGRQLPYVPALSWSLAQIGLLSFAWYLIHENIGMSMLATFDLYLPAQVALWLVIASTFIMAIVFSAAFEWRFRKPVERVAVAVLDRLAALAARLSGPRSKPAA
ncbi:acyltransferase family protein [Devosia chinhatensis]|uniref:acyltransferase family protein n=1 Tax=Devosia chinhatensis TaxID=429727 RepID=UPI000697D1F5|nr:acyltransferase [Devosia chinhatensis]